MSPTPLARRLALGLVLVLLLLAAPAGAQDTERDPAAAQALFDEALALRKEGKLEAACDKLAESHRLDPQMGTLYNLGDCYSRIGRIASAWAAFVELEGAARKAGDPRADVAQERADELKPKLSSLRIDVGEPVEGLVVMRDEVEVGQAQWGSAVPVDPGGHIVIAKAPGYKKWSQSVVVEAEGVELEVVVPALEKLPNAKKAQGDGNKAGDAAMAAQGQLVAGIVFTSLGGVGLVVAAALQIVAKQRDDESLEHCKPDDPNDCDDTGVTLRDEAIQLQTGAIITLVAGGALAITGAILLLTLPDEEDEAGVRILPELAPGYAGLGVRARW
jgi:serine/threonine-protein kinase